MHFLLLFRTVVYSFLSQKKSTISEILLKSDKTKSGRFIVGIILVYLLAFLVLPELIWIMLR